MKIIEFIGTPGAGKTTLMPVVIQYLRELGFGAYTIIEAARPFAQRTIPGKVVCSLAPVKLRQPLLWQVFYHLSTLYRLKFTITRAKLTRRAKLSQRGRPLPEEARHYALYWFFHLVGYTEFLKAHARSNEVLVVDEGYLHRVVQLYASEMDEPDLAQVLGYVDLLPRPYLVIVTQAPLEVCKERIYSRGLWVRFNKKSPEDVSRFLSNCDQVVNLAVERIHNAGWNVIEVDNSSADPGLAKEELRRKLSGLPLVAPRIPQFNPEVEY